MFRETLALVTLQSSILFLTIWVIFRRVPSIPANTKAWIWRLAFLKPIFGFLPLLSIPLHVLPAATAPPLISPATMASMPVEIRQIAAQSRPLTVPSPSSDVDLLLVLWAIGAFVVAGYGLAGFLRATANVKQAQRLDDPQTVEALRQLSDLAGLTTPVSLLTSPNLYSAMLVGGLRPAILLPSAENLTAPDKRMMLAHEVTHLVRRDLAWFGLIWVVQALFFFNPVIWLAAHAARLDHESATDRDAAKLAAVPIQTYGEMLLRTTVVLRSSLVPGIVPMAESFRSIHRRLEAMKQFQSTPSRTTKSIVLTLTIAASAFFPFYRLAEAAPLQGRGSWGQLVFSLPKSAKNPFKYSVYKVGSEWWIQIEKDGETRRYQWENGRQPGADGSIGWVAPAKNAGPNIIDASFENCDVREVLRKTFRVVPKSFDIDLRVQGMVSVSARNIPFEVFLQNVVRQVNAELKIEGGMYKITPMSSGNHP